MMGLHSGGGLHFGGLETQATEFGSGHALTESLLWGLHPRGLHFRVWRLGLPILDLVMHSLGVCTRGSYTLGVSTLGSYTLRVQRLGLQILDLVMIPPVPQKSHRGHTDLGSGHALTGLGGSCRGLLSGKLHSRRLHFEGQAARAADFASGRALAADLHSGGLHFRGLRSERPRLLGSRGSDYQFWIRSCAHWVFKCLHSGPLHFGGLQSRGRHFGGLEARAADFGSIMYSRIWLCTDLCLMNDVEGPSK